MGQPKHDIIRSYYDPEREARAVREWWRRNSLIFKVKKLAARDEALAQRLVRHAERWGWTGLMDAARHPVECPTCDGWGRFDDIPCHRCDGRGII
ncbi:MAG: hypothetical protein N2557_07885 [Hydrogenophilus sp.]|nr:hypothetical protein [Hydrogenophilus sp.]